MSVKLYRIKEVSDITGLKPSSIYKQIRNNCFPAGIKITSRSTAWPSNLIDEWIGKKIKGEKL
jgi:predicted DNA-binding transcriptional regulator AlpA